LGPARKKERRATFMAVNGILGIKLGMAQVFTDDGMAVGCTVLQAGPCVVCSGAPRRRRLRRRAAGLVEFIKPQRVTKPMLGHFKKSDAAPMRRLGEVRLDDSADETKAGDRVLVDRFQPRRVGGRYRHHQGKGFAGAVKRWHFRGGDETHGSMHHRAPGGIGGSSFPSRFGPGNIFRGTWESPLNGKKPPRRESGHRRKFASGVRLGARSGGNIHSYPEGPKVEVTK